jgi:hypothetical protein
MTSPATIRPLIRGTTRAVSTSLLKSRHLGRSVHDRLLALAASQHPGSPSTPKQVDAPTPGTLE